VRIQLKPKELFNLDFALCCGQVFRWDKQSDWWFGVVRDVAFKIRQIGDELQFENADASFVMDYFRLGDDLPKILLDINKDPHINRAVDAFRGLRVLRQDPWECLVSYVCATYKGISAIKQMLFNLSREFGEKIAFDGRDFYAFPEPERLARATDHDLARCGLGYRAKYVANTAKIVCDKGFDFERLKHLTYEEAREELMDLPGVGPKVADCILLFSLEKLQAFPVDVWVNRVIQKYYTGNFPEEFITRISNKRSLTDSEYKKLNLFGRSYFGEFAGYAQEYLYHYERTKCRVRP
jgi:N-glycosylase/DNA lyase